MPGSELMAYAKEMEERYYLTISSTSWKITAPLRAVIRVFTGILLKSKYFIKSLRYNNIKAEVTLLKKLGLHHYLIIKKLNKRTSVALEKLNVSSGNEKRLSTNPYFNIRLNKGAGRNILFVTHYLHNNGAPIVLMYMAKTVLENGDFPVIVSPIDGPLRQKYLDLGIPVIIDESIYHTTNTDFSDFESFSKTFDLVIINSLASGRASIALYNSSTPVIWWIHESPVALKEYKHCLPDRLSANIKTFTVSDYSANSLNSAGLSYDFGRLVYGTPDYAATLSLSLSKLEKNNSDDEIVFLTIGSLEYRKAQDVIISALPYIEKDLLNKAKFVFIGSSHDSRIKKMCLLAGSEYRNIAVLENLSSTELLEWYIKSDCLILPSREDPLPVVATEAMLFSKPVICSDKTGTADYITPLENGLIFPSEDSKALAEHITYAIDNRAKMAQMGHRARKGIYEKYFTINTFKENVLTTINNVLKSS